MTGGDHENPINVDARARFVFHSVRTKTAGGVYVGNIKLEGSDWKRICDTLGSSFTKKGLDAFVEMNFGRLHDEVDFSQAPAYATFELVKVANAHGMLDQILATAARERPFRSDLRALVLYYARQSGWSAPVATHDLDVKGALEELTVATDPFVNTSQLAQWIIRVERQVCLVRCGNERGTGFLVAPDLVLTCYHVVKEHLKGTVPSSEVQVRFDYRQTPTGGPPPPYDNDWEGLAAGWTIPNAPYSKADVTLVGDPGPHELDFALLRLKSPKGSENPPGEESPRGWVDLSKEPRTPPLSAPILIVQHPGVPYGNPPQMPLKISFATPGFASANGNGTRFVYYPSTLPGSSGSPVFDAKLTPVALHHKGGDLDPTNTALVKNNRGIPLAKIRAALDDATRALLIAPPGA